MPEETNPKIQNLPGNSYASKKPTSKEDPPEKEVKRVTTGEAVQRKKGFGAKFRETMGGDDVRSVGQYLIFEVFIPAAKNMLADAAKEGAERMLFGDSRGRARPGMSGTRNTTYSAPYRQASPGVQSGSRAPNRPFSYTSRATHEFDEIILDSRAEAEQVLDELVDLIDRFDMAKVKDLYTMVGITPSYVDDQWGWTDLSQASSTQVRQGYLLDLPRPISLKK